MISQTLYDKRTANPRATQGLNQTGARSRPSIPDHVDYVPHQQYRCAGTEETLFGPDAPTISVPQWRPALGSEDGQEEAQLSPARPKSLSRQDEELLFMRYNCARYRLAKLSAQQRRRFSEGRVSEMLAWDRRTRENRAALIDANMGLVLAMAKRMTIHSVEFDELVSEGNLALLRAVDKFDFSRGFKFSTYACSAILKAFSRLAAKAETYRRRFPVSFVPEMERSNELEWRDAEQRDLALEDLRRVLRHDRAGLTHAEQTVVGARFTVISKNRALTLQELSVLLNLSKERIRQVQNGALTKLRLALESYS